MRIRAAIVTVVAIAGVALVAVGCQQQQQRTTQKQEKSTVSVQTALGDLDAALASAKTLNNSSTAADVEKTAQDIRKAWGEVKSSASQLSGDNRKLLDESYQTFQKKIDGIPSNAAIAQRAHIWVTGAIAFGESVKKVMQSYQPSTATTGTPGTKATP